MTAARSVLNSQLACLGSQANFSGIGVPTGEPSPAFRAFAPCDTLQACLYHASEARSEGEAATKQIPVESFRLFISGQLSYHAMQPRAAYLRRIRPHDSCRLSRCSPQRRGERERRLSTASDGMEGTNTYEVAEFMEGAASPQEKWIMRNAVSQVWPQPWHIALVASMTVLLENHLSEAPPGVFGPRCSTASSRPQR